MPFYDENYVLSTGGDPICTPHLFRFKFFEMLHLQLSELLIKDTNNHSFASLFKDLAKCDSNEKIVEFLEGNIYNLLELGNKLNSLISANNTGSDFAASAIRNLYFNIVVIEIYEQIELFIVTLKTGLKVALFQLEKCYIEVEKYKGISDLKELQQLMIQIIKNFMK